MRCKQQQSVLVLIDIQYKLAKAMQKERYKSMKKNVQILLTAANTLSIPVITTLQYPKGLGKMDDELQKNVPKNSKTIEKTCFSCVGATAFTEHLKTLACQQVCLTGMETHICVTQTALDLLQAGYQVFLAEDASCSRRQQHHENATLRLRKAGVHVAVAESILFEWLQDAKHMHFKTLSKLIV